MIYSTWRSNNKKNVFLKRTVPVSRSEINGHHCTVGALRCLPWWHHYFSLLLWFQPRCFKWVISWGYFLELIGRHSWLNSLLIQTGRSCMYGRSLTTFHNVWFIIFLIRVIAWWSLEISTLFWSSYKHFLSNFSPHYSLKNKNMHCGKKKWNKVAIPVGRFLPHGCTRSHRQLTCARVRQINSTCGHWNRRWKGGRFDWRGGSQTVLPER